MAQSESLHGVRGFQSGGSTTIEVDGIIDVQERLAQLKTTHPNMDKDLKKIMRYVIKEARKKLMQKGQSEVGTGYPNSQGDSRKAYRAVKSMVYKRIFGGNVNIISRRKRSGRVADVPEQKQQVGRGGNRRARSYKTQQMMSYWGEDRGFILRWLNSGTSRRQIKTENNASVNKGVSKGHTSASLQSKRNGNRGHIAGNGWFGNASMDAMYQASESLTSLIDRAITEVWGDGAVKNAESKFR